MYGSGQKEVPVLLARTTGSTSYNSCTVVRTTLYLLSRIAIRVPYVRDSARTSN